MSRIAIRAWLLEMLVLSSPREPTRWTARNERDKAETRDCATPESLWRSTTLSGFILPSTSTALRGGTSWGGSRGRGAPTQTLMLQNQVNCRSNGYFRPDGTSATGSNGSA